MNMTSPTISPNAGHDYEEELASIEQIKRKARARKLRAARSLAARMQIMPDGSRVFIRFNRTERFEHQVLIVTFTTLAVTGLLQRYSQHLVVGWIINLLGGVETMRTLHHLAAFVFILEAVYHTWRILVIWFVKRERGAMWPSLRDFRDLVHMVKFNLGLVDHRPEFDRFTVEEKLEYWALLWGAPLMIITGLMMWFPVTVTSVLPGDAIPVARALHGWEAILATLSILIWHMYHTVIKERNRSIFTGIMTEKEMQHAHPLEYRRILAAYAYLQKVAAEEMPTEEGPTHPQKILAGTGYEATQGVG